MPGGGTVIYVGNLTNFGHTGLTAGATYCYKIWSVNGSNQYSAGLAPVCATPSRDWTGNVNTDWFNTGNWGPARCRRPRMARTFQPDDPSTRSLTPRATCYHLTIESGALVSMHAATPLYLPGDWRLA
ncbi:MAG: hypothetical protein IPM81_22870 [Saprospirales bacterium]|nr:hypothetical protein [Saprospirales bacterium]